MKTITKAQIAAENAALRKQVGDLKLDLEIAQSQAAADLAAANEALRIARGGVPIPKFLRASHAQLPAHMQAAKDMAMKAGITVKVGSTSHEDFDARR